MCEFVIENRCKITKLICPYMEYCKKLNGYKPLSSMPKSCKQAQIAQKTKPPRGFYSVLYARKGCLFIDIKGTVYKFKNPFNHIPEFVKVRKTNGAWEIVVGQD